MAYFLSASSAALFFFPSDTKLSVSTLSLPAAVMSYLCIVMLPFLVLSMVVSSAKTTEPMHSDMISAMLINAEISFLTTTT